MGITSRVNNQAGLEQSEELLLINSKSSIFSLSQISYSCSPLLSQQQIERNQQMKTLKDLTRLLNLVMR